MPTRAGTPQRLRGLGAGLGERVVAASRSVGKTSRALASKVRNSSRPQIVCDEVDADGVVRARTFTLHKMIGGGAYSCVFKACERQPDGRAHDYAVKRVRAQDTEARRRVRGEIELMRRLPPHPNILHMTACSVDEAGYGMVAYLVLEMCRCGSVAQYLISRDGEPLDLPQVYKLLFDMAHALAHLHAQHPPIAHRDFKLENMLIASDGFAKLCDFGSATCRARAYTGTREREDAEEEFHRMSTAQYRPPEMFDLHRGHVVSEKADVWALGIAFFKLVCNRDACAPGEERLSALNGTWRQRIPDGQPGAINRARLRTPDPLSTRLLEMLLTETPQSRPSVAELLQWLSAQPARPGVMPAGGSTVSPVGESYRPGRLWVSVRGARGLLCKGVVTSSPICYARVVSEGMARETVDATGPAPVWDGRFAFITHSLSRVHVSIWQRQPAGLAHEFLGQSVPRVAALLREQGANGAAGWLALDQRSDKSHVAGSVHVKLEFEPLTPSRDDWATWSAMMDNGGHGGTCHAPRRDEPAGGERDGGGGTWHGTANGAAQLGVAAAPSARAHAPPPAASGARAQGAGGAGYFGAADGADGTLDGHAAERPSAPGAPALTLIDLHDGSTPPSVTRAPHPAVDARARAPPRGRPLVATHAVAVTGAAAGFGTRGGFAGARPAAQPLVEPASLGASGAAGGWQGAAAGASGFGPFGFDPFGLGAFGDDDDDDDDEDDVRGSTELISWQDAGAQGAGAQGAGGAPTLAAHARQAAGFGARGDPAWGAPQLLQQQPAAMHFARPASGGSSRAGPFLPSLSPSPYGSCAQQPSACASSSLAGSCARGGAADGGCGGGAPTLDRPFAPTLDLFDLVADPLARPPALPPSLHEREAEKAAVDWHAPLPPASFQSGDAPPARPSLPADLLGMDDLLLDDVQPARPQPQPQPQTRISSPPRSVQSAMLDAFAPPMLPTQQQPPMLPTQQQPPMLPTQQQPPMLPTQQQPPMLPTQQQPPLVPNGGAWASPAQPAPALAGSAPPLPLGAQWQAPVLRPQPARAQPAAEPLRGPGTFWS